MTAAVAAGRPVVIRKVVRSYRNGVPKVARDRRSRLQLERVQAVSPHPCGYKGCPSERLIESGSVYVIARDPVRDLRRGPIVIPDQTSYHPGCVPPPYRPLLRLLQLGGVSS